jgi:hypothetical protein
LQSTHQVDIKNVEECQKEFFAYFNALETYGDTHHTFYQIVFRTHIATCDCNLQLAEVQPQIASHALQIRTTYRLLLM